MNSTLKKIKNIVSENCITIIMTTHRTGPDYLKDEVMLKNHIKEVEARISANTDNQNSTKLMAKLNQLATEVDHSHNLDSLMLFVNEDIAEYTRLPIKVKDRVVIDDNFATRDLIRAMHIETSYYVLVLSQEKARLIEAMNGETIKEFGDTFPLETKLSHAKHSGDHPSASHQTNLIAEFFNRVDKEVNKFRNSNPLPLLIGSVKENYHQYLNVADDKRGIFDTYLNSHRIEDNAATIVSEAWKIVKTYTIKKNNERKAELEKAVGANKFLSDINEIWRAISAGRVKTLFIEQGLFQPAVLKNNDIVLVPEEQKSATDIIDDIYDEMIEANMAFGGDVVFLPKGELKEFNGFGAVTRY